MNVRSKPWPRTLAGMVLVLVLPLLAAAPPALAALQLVKGRVGAGGLNPTLVGTLALGGTAGQPEAGDVTRLSYLLRGGFWLGVAEVTAVPAIEPPGGDPTTALAFRVSPIRPNPVRASASISFELPLESEVRLELFDVRGRLVRTFVDRRMPPGRHETAIQTRDQAGRELPAGVYLMLLHAGPMTRRQNLVIVR